MGKVKRIALVGASSIGKTTLAHQLVGRLRTHDILAVMSSDSGMPLPFDVQLLDTEWEGYAYKLFKKLADECAIVLRPNVEFMVCDRSAIDIYVWLMLKNVRSDISSRLLTTLTTLSMEWMRGFNQVYFLPVDGVADRNDGFRNQVGDYRDQVDGFFKLHWGDLAREMNLVRVNGTMRERSEFVYHDILSTCFGKDKPKRATEQLRRWIETKYPDFPVFEIRVIGSNSINRFHIATQEDDYDFVVAVDTTPDEARVLNDRLAADNKYLDRVLEAVFDVKVIAKDMLPHEV